MKSGKIIGLIIVALAVCGGGFAYFNMPSEEPAPITVVQKKKLDTKKTDCKAAVTVVPAVGLVAGIGVATAVAACQ